jgi:hypothetical protein
MDNVHRRAAVPGPWTNLPWWKRLVLAVALLLAFLGGLLFMLVLLFLFLMQLGLLAFFAARRLLFGIPIPDPPAVDEPPNGRQTEGLPDSPLGGMP